MVSLIPVDFGTWPRTTSLPSIAIIVVVMFYVSYLLLLATIGLSINLPACLAKFSNVLVIYGYK